MNYLFSVLLIILLQGCGKKANLPKSERLDQVSKIFETKINKVSFFKGKNIFLPMSLIRFELLSGNIPKQTTGFKRRILLPKKIDSNQSYINYLNLKENNYFFKSENIQLFDLKEQKIVDKKIESITYRSLLDSITSNKFVTYDRNIKTLEESDFEKNTILILDDTKTIMYQYPNYIPLKNALKSIDNQIIFDGFSLKYFLNKNKWKIIKNGSFTYIYANKSKTEDMFLFNSYKSKTILSNNSTVDLSKFHSREIWARVTAEQEIEEVKRIKRVESSKIQNHLISCEIFRDLPFLKNYEIKANKIKDSLLSVNNYIYKNFVINEEELVGKINLDNDSELNLFQPGNYSKETGYFGNTFQSYMQHHFSPRDNDRDYRENICLDLNVSYKRSMKSLKNLYKYKITLIYLD